MIRGRILLTICLSTALLCCGVMSGCKAKGSEGSGRQGGARAAAPVRVGTVGRQALPVQQQTFGTVEPIHAVQIKAQVSGMVREVLFEEGAVVDKGQVLFVIDKRPYEVALRQAKANVAKAHALLEQAQAMLARDKAQAVNCRAILSRDQELKGKGMVSNEKFDQSVANAEAAEASVAADEANIKSATEAIAVSNSEVDDAELQLSYCEICSPITGRTGAVALKPGNLVKANDAEALVTINQISPIYVSFSMSEPLLGDIVRYQSAGALKMKAWAPGGEHDASTGQLTFLDNQVDTSNGMIRMRGTFPNDDQRLWPGQYVNVLLEMTVEADMVVVPSSAILAGQQGPYAYVVTADLKAELRHVKPGQTVDGLTVVHEGLQPGEKVIVDGQLRVVEGAVVTVVDDAADEQAGAK